VVELRPLLKQTKHVSLSFLRVVALFDIMGSKEGKVVLEKGNVIAI
jgi:hypothetical protein